MSYILKLYLALKSYWEIVLHYWQPIGMRIQEWTAPIRKFTKPIVDFISPYFDPIRSWWSTVCARYPIFGRVATFGLLAFKSLMIFLFCLIVFTRIGLFGRMPSNKELRNVQTQNAAEVYSQDSVLLGRYYIINRTTTKLDSISDNVVNALIATEDTRFYEHGGIDYRAYVRVIAKTLLLQDESSGGGSTITQQLAKNLYPRKNYWLLSTLINKIQEAFIALKLERCYSKKEIVNLYLNTVPFSNNVYGITMGAKRFFNKTADNLTIDEAATLIGMLKATTQYDPRRNMPKSKERRNTVMKLMEKQGFITEKEYNKLSPIDTKLEYQEESYSDGIAAYLREYLRTELPELLKKPEYKKKDNGQPYNIYRDGLRIYTTINSRMQQYAEDAVRFQMPKVQKNFKGDWRYANKKSIPWENDTLVEVVMKNTKRYSFYHDKGKTDQEIKKIFQTAQADSMTVFDWEAPNREKKVKMTPWDSLKYYLQVINAGFVAMDPKTGAVKAWVGGIDHRYFKYDHIKAKRQVGSTFKPIVYASAIQRGISPCTFFSNNKKSYFFRGEEWEPGNADEDYGGSYTMRTALKKSLNVVSVQLILQKTPEIKPDTYEPTTGGLLIEKQKTGIEETIELAKKMGITSVIKDVPSIALGTVDVNLFDMMKVYGTFANRGLRPNPYLIDRITLSDGTSIFENQAQNMERVLTEDQSDLMIDLMKSVVEEGTGGGMHSYISIDNNIAGKTGTTQDHADAWFMCYTPTLVCGAWGGADMPKVHFRSLEYGQGASVALPICGKFLEKVFSDPKLRKLANETFVIPKPEVQEMLNCPGFISDSSYVDSLGVKHWVPGSVKDPDAEEKAKEEEQKIEEAIKEGINDIWKVPDGETGLAYEQQKVWGLVRKENWIWI
ncbi:MAG: transglycosylase domain-containing protein [Saprospiraceae bacterium]